MSIPKLNVAIVGCGQVANDHIKSWHKVRQARAVAVCDVNKETARSFAQRYGINRYYTDLIDLLENEEVSIVDICTPPQTHRDLGLQAMRARKHVIFEKPLTITTSDAKSIIEHKPSDIKVGVIHNLLFEPPILELDSLIKRGELGDIISLQIDMLHGIHDRMLSNKGHWCHRLPGGRFGEMLSHPIYLLHNFLGYDICLREVRTSKLGPYEWVSKDELYVLLEDESRKRFGRVYVSFNSPVDALYVTVIGSKGIAKAEVITGTVIKLAHLRMQHRLDKGKAVLRQSCQMLLSLAKNVARVLSGKWVTGLQKCIQLFANSVLEGKELPPPITLDSAYRNVKIVEEICAKIEKSGSS